MLRQLLQANPALLKLLKSAPFGSEPPRHVRVRFYRYEFTSSRERRETGAIWKRHCAGDTLPPLSLDDFI